MQKSGYIPEDYDRIDKVHDIVDLVASFDRVSRVNCRVLQRALPADIDFAPLANCMDRAIIPGDPIQFAELAGRDLREVARHNPDQAVRTAAAFIANDVDNLSGIFKTITLRAIRGYSEQDKIGAHVLHVDGADILNICYNAPLAKYARNDDIADVRTVNGEMAYMLRDGAKLHSFQAGDMYFTAGLKSKWTKEGFVHQGANAPKDGPPRLLLYAYNWSTP